MNVHVQLRLDDWAVVYRLPAQSTFLALPCLGPVCSLNPFFVEWEGEQAMMIVLHNAHPMCALGASVAK